MHTLPFDHTKIDYNQRIIREKNPAPLSRVRITLFGKSGNPYQFNLYTFAPCFEKEPRHLFSSCGRVIVMRNRVDLAAADADEADIVTIPGQYFVFFNGNRVPEDRYIVRERMRERGGKRTSAWKQTRGAAENIAAADRAEKTRIVRASKRRTL